MTGILHVPHTLTRAGTDGPLAEVQMSSQWSELPSSLKAEQHGAVAVLKLARAQKRNALDDPTVLGIETFFTTLPDEIRAVVIAGEGEHFSAGLDLSELSERNTFEGIDHSRSW